MTEGIWQPHPGPQTDFCSRWEFEVFYGGQAGPGKTDCLVAEALRDTWHPGYKGLILRRTFPELEEIMDRCQEMYPTVGGYWNATKKRWYFPPGGFIRLDHMQHEKDKYRFRGKEYQYVGWDEGTRFSGTQYLYLFSRTRSKFPEIKPRVRSGSNPGGEGHQFFKDRFQIGITEPGTTIYDLYTGLSRVFIRGQLSDNPTLLLNDPDYVRRLWLLPEIERMRLLEGIWDAFEGQAIPELNRKAHSMEENGIAPHDIPPEWTRYRTFDWGYATPFSVGWWAVDPDGRLYRYHEWYGAKEGDQKNIGLRMTASEVGREIKKTEKENGWKVRPGPADPDLWNPRWSKMGKGKSFGVIGASPAEDMSKEGITFIQADNDRLLGRQQVHKRLELDEKGDPQVMISDKCKDFWRTMPLLRESEHNPEEIESKDVEDHIYSEFRYMCMFRPIKPRIEAPMSDLGSFQHERRKYIRAKQLAARRGISLADAYGRLR